MVATTSEAEPETEDAGAEAVAGAPSARGAVAPSHILVASTVLTVLGLLLYLQNRVAPGTSQFFDPVGPLVALTAPALGAVLASRRPSDPVGWLLCGCGWLAVAFFAEQYAVYSLVSHPGSLPAGTWMAWLGSWAWMPGLLPLPTLLVLYFPDGRLPSPRWRPLAWAVVTTITVAVAAAALAPDSVSSPSPVNPAGISALPQLSTLVQVAIGACGLLLAPLCLAALAIRFHRSTAKQRDQMRWFVAAAVLAVLAPFLGILSPLGLHEVLGLLGLVGLSAGVVVGAVEYRLYEVDRRELDVLTSRGMVYGVLVVTSVALYWVTVRVLDVGFGVRTGVAPSVVAVLVVAAALRPTGRLVGNAVEHLRSPRRAYHALISLGRCLDSSIAPDMVLPALVETIAAALELPYVAVEVGRGEDVTAAAVHGEPRGEMMVVPLVHHDEVVGRLTVAPPPGEHLHACDLRLLRDLASQAGAAAYSVRLTADLRVSKERLVTAREEEWRRARRELHDRIGPLDGVLLGISAAANTLDRGDGPGTRSLLARLKTELRSEVADIRALIDRLRPRSLDDLGLVGALDRQAALSALPPRPLAVIVNTGELGVLPAGVEVAAYQIVCEALTNVRRHAAARRCEIRLSVHDGWLELEVADDGVGLPAGFQEGVGLSCMRERAAELGGNFSVEGGPENGTSVCVEIPVGES